MMGVAYSQDLRDRVMAAVDGGLGVYSAAPARRDRRAASGRALPERAAQPPSAHIAAAISFLAGPAATMITGHTLAVDGGFLAQ
jgi:NAD(P)-dependent dehydrogenase (short-subunit alcohol dehydrogenase family)